MIKSKVYARGGKMKKIVLIGPVYPYKGGIAHYTSLLYRALSCKYEVELISFKMQYPKFLFRKEQKDYCNDMFRVPEAQFLINTANPVNIILTAQKIKKKETRFNYFAVVASIFCPLLSHFGSCAWEKSQKNVYLP